MATANGQAVVSRLVHDEHVLVFSASRESYECPMCVMNALVEQVSKLVA